MQGKPWTPDALRCHCSLMKHCDEGIMTLPWSSEETEALIAPNAVCRSVRCGVRRGAFFDSRSERFIFVKQISVWSSGRFGMGAPIAPGETRDVLGERKAPTTTENHFVK